MEAALDEIQLSETNGDKKRLEDGALSDVLQLASVRTILERDRADPHNCLSPLRIECDEDENGKQAAGDGFHR
jgi:hypothetical protein